jgi:hypothetical protein
VTLPLLLLIPSHQTTKRAAGWLQLSYLSSDDHVVGMPSWGFSGKRRPDPLPPLSPSPQRSTKDRDIHCSSDDAEHSCPVLQVAGARIAEGNNTNSSTDISSSIQHPQSASMPLPTQTSPGGRGTGSGVPPLSSSSLGLQNHMNHSTASGGVVLKRLPGTGDSGGSGDGSILVSRTQCTTAAPTTAGADPLAAAQRCPGGTAAHDNSTTTLSPLPQPTRTVAFSSSEQEPHMPPPAPHPSSSAEPRGPRSGSTTTRPSSAFHAPGANDAVAAGRRSHPAVPPFEGVFLQPSTFRIGATGQDVLWALYQTNGVVASYLDPPPTTVAVGAGASSGASPPPSPPSAQASTAAVVASAAALRASASSSSFAAAAAVGGSSTVSMPRKASNTPLRSTSGVRERRHHRSSGGGNCSFPLKQVGVATPRTTSMGRRHRHCCNASGGGSGGHDPSGFADVEAEIVRCLSGAGGSTPCLLSFDYIIKPARVKHFTEDEIRVLRDDPIVNQLQATGVNEVEEAVPGSSRGASHAHRAATSTAEAGAAAATTTATKEEEQRQQHLLMQRKELWFREVPGTAGAAVPDGPLRRRACGEVVQSCLYAARRAGCFTRSKLHLCEPLACEPRSLSSTGGGGGGSSFTTAHGSIYHLLSGSTVAEGGRLMPSPLWNGIQVALATMLVGEAATFLMNSDDTTRFSAPLDSTTYIRAGTSAAATTAHGASGAPSTAGSTSTWAGSASDPPPRSPTVSFSHGTVGQRSTMTFITPTPRCRSSSSTHTVQPHSRGRTGESRRRSGSERHRRSRSSSMSSHHRSPSAVSSTSPSSLLTSPASSRASSSRPSTGHDRRHSASPHSPEPQHQQQRPSQPPLHQHKSSTLFSRMQDWRRKSRSTGDDKSTAREKRKAEEEAAALSSQQPLFPQTSPTRTYPPPRRNSSNGTCPTASNTRELPVTANLTMVKPTPRPPQRTSSPMHSAGGGPAPLPSFAPVVPEDVRAYEAAVYAAVEPVSVFLRLRERIPLLPIRSTGAHPSLLISAEPVVERGTATPPPVDGAAKAKTSCINSSSGGGGDCGDTLVVVAGAPSVPPLQPSSGPTPVAEDLSSPPHQRSLSNVSESGQRRGVMTDALLCLHGSNLMRRSLATTFHYLLAHQEMTRGGGEATLAFEMESLLNNSEVRNASRAALFTAMMYVMDGKLLNTRDHAHALEGGCSANCTVEQPLRSDDKSVGGDGADLTELGATTTTTTSAGGDAGAASAGVPLAASTAVPTRYLWMPYFRVKDAVGVFAHYWSTGDFGNSSSDGKGRGLNSSHSGDDSTAPHMSSVSTRALQRTLEEFTRYAHDTATVTYMVSTYNCATCTYEPYVYPLLRNAVSATAECVGAASPHAIRSSIGCVVHPCWLDAVLQAGQHPTGADIHVVTRGHPAETEERLFVCSVLSDITATSQEAAAAFAAPRPSTPMDTTDAAADTLRVPTAPSGGSTRPTTANIAAALSTTTNTTTTTITSSHPAARSDAYANADRLDAAARRSLAASRQLLKRRGGEQRYRVRVLACEPVLTPQHFFATSPKDGLAAARALLVDAAALLDYYYRVMDELALNTRVGVDSAALPATHTHSRGSLCLVAAVPPALRRCSRLSSRSQHSRPRLPYLFFGDDRAVILAAATARAQSMGYTTSCGAVPDPQRAPGTSDASISPPIEAVAAALMLFAPCAASAAPTLATRIPLALERVLLKVLPMLYLAIFLLTYGVEEGEATPGAALEQVYGLWWSHISSAPPSRSPQHVSPSRPTFTATRSPTPTPLAQVEESGKAFCRRYNYLGECFHYLAFLYAELPGVRSMSWEACSMALYYLPRDPSLWALWGVLSDGFGRTHEAAAALRVAVQLLTMEDQEKAGRKGEGSASAPPPAKPLETPAMVAAGVADQLSRSTLLQFLRERL